MYSLKCRSHYSSRPSVESSFAPGSGSHPPDGFWAPLPPHLPSLPRYFSSWYTGFWTILPFGVPTGYKTVIHSVLRVRRLACPHLSRQQRNVLQISMLSDCSLNCIWRLEYFVHFCSESLQKVTSTSTDGYIHRYIYVYIYGYRTVRRGASVSRETWRHHCAT